MKKVKLKTAAHVKIDTNARALKIYPVENEHDMKPISTMETVGFRLSPAQVIHLVGLLIVASWSGKNVLITGYRNRRRTDGTYGLTVTFAKEEE